MSNKNTNTLRQNIEFVNMISSEVQLMALLQQVGATLGMDNDHRQMLKDIVQDKVKQLHAMYFKKPVESAIVSAEKMQ